MNNDKPFGNIDFSEFIVPYDDSTDNIFMQDQQMPSLPDPVNAMVQTAGQADTGYMNVQNIANPPVSSVLTLGNNAMNRNESSLQSAMRPHPAHMQGNPNVAVMPAPQRNMMQHNESSERSSTMNNPVASIGGSFNPYADYLRASQKAVTEPSNYVMEANMQGPVVPIPNCMPNPNQFVPSLQAPNMYGMIPNVFPEFPSGVGRVSGKKKSAKVTAYDIMTDFITRVPIFTHKQKVYIYDGMNGYYKYTSQYEVEQMIMDYYRAIIRESGSGTLIEKVYKLLLKEPQIVRNEIPLSDPAKISFANCTVDLQNRTMDVHSPADVVTHALNCDYARFDHRSEECPVFDKFLRDISGGDWALEQRLLETLGYCLTPDTNAKVFFVLQGVPNSGKSKFSDLAGSFFPEEKVSALNVHSLKEQYSMGNLDSMALCISPDLPASPLDPKSASCIKQLTGNDKVSAAVKYKNNTQFRFEGKLILATNYPLLTEEPDDAFMQRAVVIPFLHAIPRDEQDGDLLERLKAEKPAIASKALDAYFRLRDNHYTFSGNYAINSSLLYPDDLLGGSEITPFVYNYLLNCFERDPDGQVAIGDAYTVFSHEISNQFTEKMFSASFQRLAEEIYGANKIRSYHDGRFKNARSTIEGIRFKHMIYCNN